MARKGFIFAGAGVAFAPAGAAGAAAVFVFRGRSVLPLTGDASQLSAAFDFVVPTGGSATAMAGP